jgi:Ser/Thr protein kinase RdoA (MazF antagonist)
MSHSNSQMAEVLAQYDLTGAGVEPLGNGLINETWLVTAAGGERFVLQRISAMFEARLNLDIDALTTHLDQAGMPTFRLVRAQDSRLCDGLCTENGGRIWRLLTYVDGVSFNSLQSSAYAHSAGALLARFHRSIDDFDFELSTRRPGIHDTERHIAFLRDTLSRKTDHPEYRQISSLASEILAAADTLPELAKTQDRMVHGDPKINNILFAADSTRALSLIDFDTISRMPLPLELGDAMRSWCNPASEDDRYGEFSIDLFESAIGGYAEEARGWITAVEAAAIIDATHIILIELGARFCADALNESYFGWNSHRFESRSQHNQVRAAGQLTVAHSLIAQREQCAGIVKAVFGN